jgi:hypothetical protein
MCLDDKTLNAGYAPKPDSSSDPSASDGTYSVTSIPWTPSDGGWSTNEAEEHLIGNDLVWKGKDSLGTWATTRSYYPPMPYTAHGVAIVNSDDDEEIYVLNIILGVVSVTQEEYRYFGEFHKFKTLEEAVMNKDIYGIKDNVRFGILLLEHMMNLTFNRSYSQTLDVAGFVRDWPSTLESPFYTSITANEEFVRHIVDRMLYLRYIEKIRTEDCITDAQKMYDKVGSTISGRGDNDD